MGESEQEISKGENQSMCSLCGDVGFPNDLILCQKCGFRLQHTYCSRFYPDLDMATWCCEWCLYEEEKQASRRNKVFQFLLEIAQSLPEKSPEEDRICRREDSFAPEEKRFAGNRDSPGTETSQKTGSIIKKQIRCFDKNKALDRWRSLAKSKLNCRRYKLLADVLC